jgi:hypothetical protein
MNSTPDKLEPVLPIGNKPDDASSFLLAGVACGFAFLLGISITAAVALASQRDNLREQLQRERENPRTIVVERTVRHD